MSVNLFCFPFAGGSSYSYSGFRRRAPPFINVIPIELPGRGERFKEVLLSNINEIVDDVFRQVNSKLEMPYAIYGHSMGCLIGYETVKRAIREGRQQPRRLFFSGSRAPSDVSHEEHYHKLDDKQFIEKLVHLGGLSKEIIEDERLMKFFMPILRADFTAIESYEFIRTERFKIPITCMIGSREGIGYSSAKAWEDETLDDVEVLEFSGNHFFIFDHQDEIMDIVGERILASG